MSETERYTPPEMRQEASPEKTSSLRPETISKIQGDSPNHAPITPERQELHKGRESLPEKEPGSPFKPSGDPSAFKSDSSMTDTQAPVSDDPSASTNDDAGTDNQASDVQ